MKGFNNDHNPVRIASNVKTVEFEEHGYDEHTVRLMTLAGDGLVPDIYVLGTDVCSILDLHALNVRGKGLTRVERRSIGLGVGASMSVLNWDEVRPLIRKAQNRDETGPAELFGSWLYDEMKRFERELKAKAEAEEDACLFSELEEGELTTEPQEEQQQAVVPYIEAKPDASHGIFNHATFGDLRVVMDEQTGEPWFVAKDVCDMFGDTHYRRSLSRLEDDEKGVTQIDTPGGKQSTTTVSESGLYSLLFYMQPQKGRGVTDAQIVTRVSALRAFKRWITHEVLPAIRKHGGYLTPKLTAEALTDPDVIIRLATELKADRERLAAFRLEVSSLKDNLALAEKEKAEVQEKANVVDTVFARPESKGGGERLTPMTSFVRCMEGLNTMAIKSDLTRLGYLVKIGTVYLVRGAYHGEDKLFVERKRPVYIAPDILLTLKGAALLSKLYLNGDLTMKKGREKAYQKQTDSYEDYSWESTETFLSTFPSRT